MPQRVEVVETDALPIQVLLVFDSSNSLTGETRAALLQASDLLLGALRPVDEVGVIAFSDEIRWLARPGLDRAATVPPQRPRRTSAPCVRVARGTHGWTDLDREFAGQID